MNTLKEAPKKPKAEVLKCVNGIESLTNQGNVMVLVVSDIQGASQLMREWLSAQRGAEEKSD